jgi:3-phosphoshikimate 1-carboxyvinyltransferase
MATKVALTELGVDIRREDSGIWRVRGVGIGGLAEPDGVLDLGNSGTGARLICGLLAGHPFTTFLTGDASLRRRPMGRVTAPLCDMGARVLAKSGGRLPLALTGSLNLIPIRYEQPTASAQVKSALLLAGLHAPGRTTVIEPAPSRDHTERMLRHLGARIGAERLENGRQAVTVIGQPELAASDLEVAGDPSSAAFLLVAAALCPGSSIQIDDVGTNPLRTGLLTCLEEMGASLTVDQNRTQAGEPVAALHVRHGQLNGIDVPPERAPTMIDEYPILAIAAACARGRTRMTGLAELKVKESDRLTAIADGLEAAGVRIERGEDSLIVEGCDGPPPGGCVIDAAHDHRIAMAFLVLGCAAKKPVEVTGAETIDTSFPDFADLMNGLGCRIETLP